MGPGLRELTMPELWEGKVRAWDSRTEERTITISRTKGRGSIVIAANATQTTAETTQSDN